MVRRESTFLGDSQPKDFPDQENIVLVGAIVGELAVFPFLEETLEIKPEWMVGDRGLGQSGDRFQITYANLAVFQHDAEDHEPRFLEHDDFLGFHYQFHRKLTENKGEGNIFSWQLHSTPLKL